MTTIKKSKPHFKVSPKSKIIISCMVLGISFLLAGLVYLKNNKFDCTKFVEETSSQYESAKTEEQYAELHDNLASKSSECEYKETDFATSVRYSYLLAAIKFVQGNFEGSQQNAKQANEWTKNQYNKIESDEERVIVIESSGDNIFGLEELSAGYPTTEISKKRDELISKSAGEN